MATEQLTDRMMSIRKGARYMGISLERLNYLIRMGEISATRYTERGKRYVERRELDAFIDRRQAETRVDEDPNTTKMRFRNIVRRTIAGSRSKA